MEDNKAWYMSKTVWGGLIAASASILGIFGYTIDTGLQEQLSETFVLGATAIGGLVAVIGRVKATKKIK